MKLQKSLNLNSNLKKKKNDKIHKRNMVKSLGSIKGSFPSHMIKNGLDFHPKQKNLMKSKFLPDCELVCNYISKLLHCKY